MSTGGAMRKTLSCEGKERYGSFSRASKVASRRAHNKGAALCAYRCTFCGKYHIGNNSGQSKASGALVDPRQAYVIYGAGPDGREVLVGYSNEPDGGAVARRLIDVSGWAVTRIVTRYSKSA